MQAGGGGLLSPPHTQHPPPPAAGTKDKGKTHRPHHLVAGMQESRDDVFLCPGFLPQPAACSRGQPRAQGLRSRRKWGKQPGRCVCAAYPPPPSVAHLPVIIQPRLGPISTLANSRLPNRTLAHVEYISTSPPMPPPPMPHGTRCAERYMMSNRLGGVVSSAVVSAVASNKGGATPAACAASFLRCLEAQLQGKQFMSAGAW